MILGSVSINLIVLLGASSANVNFLACLLFGLMSCCLVVYAFVACAIMWG